MDAIDVRGLMALLLADGSLVSYRSPSGGYVQLTLTAGIRQSAFLEEKVAEFRQFVPTKAQIVHYRSSPRCNGKTTPCLRFRVSTEKLRPIYNLLYPARARRITPAALAMLGAQAAAWLWAEGAKADAIGGAELGRIGCTGEEAQLIQQWLAMLTGAEAIEVDLAMRRPRLIYTPLQATKIRHSLLPYAPRSRQHLFRDDSWDIAAVRSARTELLLGTGRAGHQGIQAAALA